MPLDLLKLMQAGITTSKNPFLQQLRDEIRKYNEIPDAPSGRLRKIEMLDDVARIAGVYVTSKPPQPKTKNGKRWDAVDDLLGQVSGEAARLGVKQLTGPTDYRRIDAQHRSYWLEKIDPEHRPGYELVPVFANWLKDVNAIATKQSFWIFSGADLAATPADSVVKYFSEDITYNALSDMITIDGGRLVDHADQPFDTRGNETAFSGFGWAIFVFSPDAKLYAGSHVVGQHHHSSFLSGGAVKAAGEIVADAGRIQVITAKSGHYKPDAAAILRFVREFPLIGPKAIVRPDLSDGAVAKYHHVGEFRKLGTKAPVLDRGDILERTPPWARRPGFMAALPP
ncbi:MAG TPA: hypothetical protein VJ994_09760 [Paracoccaceae bacterium]|nr:hypothetical protein [Paracoccaceae bacterium]